jgi:hypothetical protein
MTLVMHRLIPILAILLIFGCGKDDGPKSSSHAIPAEITVALQETFALLDSPTPDLREVCRRAEEMAARWNAGGSYAAGLLSRPGNNSCAEALFLLVYAARLSSGSSDPVEQRLGSLPLHQTTGFPESLEALLLAWKTIRSETSELESSKARENCRALQVRLWERIKEKDPVVRQTYKRIEASAGAAVLRPLLDRQEWGVRLISEPSEGGNAEKRRYSPRDLGAAVEYGLRGTLTSAFADLGLDKSWGDGYSCSISFPSEERPVRPGPAVALRCRYKIIEGGSTVENWNRSISLKEIEIELRLQFEVDGEPVGKEIRCRAANPKKISWDQYKEAPDIALLRSTCLDLREGFQNQLTRPR